MTEEVPFPLLLASSVHDIKNSLGMLLGTLDDVVQATPQADPEQRQRFGILRGEAARINNALIALLGLYRMQQKQLHVQIDEVFVADFLDEQIAANQLLFDIRGLDVQLDCAPDLAAYFDAALVGGVIGNVLVNAAHYAHRHITVGARLQAGTLILEVNDDGPGFPEKMLQSNQRPLSGIDFGSGSTSLGLYFAAEVAQLHRRAQCSGSIELSNREKGGSCFRLLLP